ncbi:NACHT domain-containing protein [Comamonas badia]|uniref:NACHT domain-containing protein n=1 Tax=Comamonas badia TaxID=265291 RepID=UPI0004146847|nr:hypothetical protein [Comamonas badia]
MISTLLSRAQQQPDPETPETVIPRRLRQERADGSNEVTSQDALPDFITPLVILGEAGAGKTGLLKWLAETAGYAFCSARKLTTTSDPSRLLNGTNTLVIDALDELSTSRDGESVDAVLKQLAQAGYPRFILSCRVADWRSALSKSAIEEHYGVGTAELHLLPFDDNEARIFLNARVGPTEAEHIQKHLKTRNLEALLGNPQTLTMVAEVARAGPLPESKTELFDRAITLLSQEHRDEKAERQLAPVDTIESAGAACAALLLTGCEAISRRAASHNDGAIPIAELDRLVPRTALNAVLDTRLFVASGADRFTYLHRSIAEYVAARWLARKCSTDRQRRRLLAIVQGPSGVPSALRGFHAWLAANPVLTESVIRADPIGLIEYGDSDNLALRNARLLLAALTELAKRNPALLPSKDVRVPALLQPELRDEVRSLINTRATPFGLRLLLLQSLRDDRHASSFATELWRIALDQDEWYASRSAASEALIAIAPDKDWPTMVDTLRAVGGEDSTRLAMELLNNLDYARFTDQQIVETARTRALAAHQRIAAPLFMLQRRLPPERIAGVLDLLSDALLAQGDSHGAIDTPASIMEDFAYHLIARILKTRSVEAEQLWRWLKPFQGASGYQDDNHNVVNNYLRANDAIRQAIQAEAILQGHASEELWRTVWEVRQCVAGLAFSESDVIALLGALDPTHTPAGYWQSIVRLTHHDATAGAAVRNAARPFASDRPDLLAWIDALPFPIKPQWQIEREAKEEQHRTERLQRLAKVKASYAPHADAMRSGEINCLIAPAQSYLGFFHEYRDEEPVGRVTSMLGEDLSDAALAGFEAALHQPALFPGVKEIVNALADSKILNACTVLAAGIAERVRLNLGFDDLGDDCILKGFVAIYQTALGHYRGTGDFDDTIALYALQRGLWKQGIQLRVEPQLNHSDRSVHELYDVMRNDAFAQPATELAIEWLERFPEMPVMAEMEIVDRLFASQAFEPLRSAWPQRHQTSDANRRRLWLAVGLLVDFEQAAAMLSSATVDRDLLWDLRARIKRERTNSHAITLTPGQVGWVISNFRGLWPRASHPAGVSVGDTNPWDACRFLEGMISRLGNDLGSESRQVLGGLRDALEDSYTERIKIVMAEQQQALVDSSYQPQTLTAIQAVVTNSAPADIKDLQAFMLEELAVVQAKIKSDDAESWRGFFNDSNQEPHSEERCRDHLLGLLRQGDRSIHLEPETHVASDKEVDITCAVNGLRLPIEIKGQWHASLWTAADAQLNRLYASDWQAQHHGIYLVLWFGASVPKNKRLKGLLDQPTPTTPDALRNMLCERSHAARQGRIDILVLDLERTG